MYQRSSDSLYAFYNNHYQINQDTRFEIASDGCRNLKKISKGVPNSKWILSKFHATQPIFGRNNYKNQRRWLKKDSMEDLGYQDYLQGDSTKIATYYTNNPQYKLGKDLLSVIKHNQEGIQAWKDARYGNNAENEASRIKKLLEQRVLSQKSFLNLLKANEYVIIP